MCVEVASATVVGGACQPDTWKSFCCTWDARAVVPEVGFEVSCWVVLAMGGAYVPGQYLLYVVYWAVVLRCLR